MGIRFELSPTSGFRNFPCMCKCLGWFVVSDCVARCLLLGAMWLVILRHSIELNIQIDQHAEVPNDNKNLPTKRRRIPLRFGLVGYATR